LDIAKEVYLHLVKQVNIEAYNATDMETITAGLKAATAIAFLAENIFLETIEELKKT
jgi:DNA-binding transcriptional regulator WhiA